MLPRTCSGGHFSKQTENDETSHKSHSSNKTKMYEWLFASRISLRGSLLRSDSQAQFHSGANLIKKTKAVTKNYSKQH